MVAANCGAYNSSEDHYSFSTSSKVTSPPGTSPFSFWYPVDWRDSVLLAPRYPEDWRNSVHSDTRYPEDWRDSVLSATRYPEEWRDSVLLAPGYAVVWQD